MRFRSVSHPSKASSSSDELIRSTGTMLAIVAMWFLISLPLTLVGSYLALRRGPLSVPVRVNQIPRQIPPPSTWYLKPWPSAIMAGVLPFGAGFIEWSVEERTSTALGLTSLSSYFLLSSFFASKTYAVSSLHCSAKRLI